uniref:Candidate secreted effector n=1 Tax=Meloidogyne incognita TaxID=6306 RepID=A0A914MXV1_MELIC
MNKFNIKLLFLILALINSFAGFISSNSKVNALPLQHPNGNHDSYLTFLTRKSSTSI